MALTLQNLRAVVSGVEPASLLPGQLCFNLADGYMFVGDGSDYKTSFYGNQVLGVAGGGWFAVPLSYSSYEEFFLPNPEAYSPAPVDGQFLAYSSALGKPVWETPTDNTPTVYLTNNTAVTSASGATTSEKITAAIGTVPFEADSAIVTGLPGQTYQGLYLFQSGDWVFAAGYADPTAIQVPYSNLVSGLVAATVQAALDELAATKLNTASNSPLDGEILSWDAGSPKWIPVSSISLTASNVSFDPSGTGLPPSANNVQIALVQAWQLADQAYINALTAQTTADTALAVANAALPTTGGTMTGDIVFNSGQPVDAGTY